MVLRVGKDLDESNSGKVMEPMANRHSPKDGKLSQCLLFEMILVWNWGSDEHRFSIANWLSGIVGIKSKNTDYLFLLICEESWMVLLLLHLKVKNSEILREKNEENKGEEEGGYFKTIYIN
jgi:hypothetical protein